MNPRAAEFMELVKHPLKFRAYLFRNLPAAFFSGVRVRELTGQTCITTVPYKWLTRNPFGSTYFASMAMAAEMSTGVLGLMQVYRRQPSVSMLVVKVDSSYYKKTTGRTKFECVDGLLFQKSVNDCIETNESRTVTALSRGTNQNGEIVAEFYVTWSFRARPKK